MKVLKKLLSIFLAFGTVTSLLFGCSIASTSSETNLPADGIVKKSVFDDAMKNSRMLTFHGNSGTISYSWFFDGASISSLSDQNLKVDFTDAGKDLNGAVSSSKIIKLHFNEKNLIQANTTLKIDFSELWNAQKVEVYQKDSEIINSLLEAPLNNDTISSVTFPVEDTSGDFYIAAKDSSFHEDSSRVTVKSAKGVQNDSGSTVSSEKSKSAQNNSSSAKPVESSPGTESGSVSGQQHTSGISGKPGGNAASSSQGHASPASASSSGKDRYLTDPTPVGKPKPVEPQDIKKNIKQVYYCTFSIDCKTILDNMSHLSKDKESVMPGDGIILKSQKVMFYEGESVFDVLLRETKKNSIQMEYEATPIYNSNYIEGIHNLYEFDCGELSGWMYQVNDWYPNYGCSRYVLKDGDVVNWRYTCDLGRDVGCDWDVSEK